jgi:hypothetical protein
MYLLTYVSIHPDPSLRTVITLYPHGPGDPYRWQWCRRVPRRSLGSAGHWAASQVEVACVPVVAIGGLTFQGTGTLGHRATAAGGESFDTGLCLRCSKQ